MGLTMAVTAKSERIPCCILCLFKILQRTFYLKSHKKILTFYICIFSSYMSCIKYTFMWVISEYHTHTEECTFEQAQELLNLILRDDFRIYYRHITKWETLKTDRHEYLLYHFLGHTPELEQPAMSLYPPNHLSLQQMTKFLFTIRESMYM